MEQAQNAAQQIMGFDIGNLDSNAATGATFNCAVIEDADGNAVSGFIMVGKNSDQYVEATNKIRKENLQRSARRNKAIDAKTDEGAEAVVTVLTANDRTTAMAVVVGWFGFTSGSGDNVVEVKFDRAVLTKMFDKFPTWQTKVLAALENDANFIKV